MMRVVRAAMFGLLCVSAPITARAQDVPAAQRPIDPAAGLTSDQAVATALQNVPALKAAQARIAAAQARRTQARLRPNPSVSVGWREEIGGMDRMNDAMVTLPLDLFRRGPRIATAEAGIAAAEAEARAVMLAAELDVRRRYGALLAAMRRADVAAALEATARKTHELLAARAEQGAAPPLDRDLARVELERMAARARAAAADVDAAMVDLTRSMGLVPRQIGIAQPSLEALVSAPDVHRLARESDAGVIDARPDVRAAEARVRERGAAIEQARSEGRWDLSVSAGYMRMRSGFPFSAFDDRGTLRGIEATFHNVTFGAMATVPLFNRNQGAVAAAAAERSIAQAEAEAVRLGAAAEFSRAAIELRAALDVVQRYRASILPQALRNLETIEQRYELGRGTLFDVLQARQQLLQVQDEYTDTLQRAHDAYVAALGARGGGSR